MHAQPDFTDFLDSHMVISLGSLQGLLPAMRLQCPATGNFRQPVYISESASQGMLQNLRELQSNCLKVRHT